MIYEFKEIDTINFGNEFSSELYPSDGFWICNDNIYIVNKSSGYVQLLGASAILYEVEEYNN